MEIVKVVIWFFVLNCCVNSIIQTVLPCWWLIEIIIFFISIIMVDKNYQMCYNLSTVKETR